MKQKTVIVIGSVHLDVLAYHTGREVKYEDNIGQVELGIGGTAFNIAANLRGLNHDADLCSVVNQNKFTGRIVREALKVAGFRNKYILHDPDIGNSAFVGHLFNGDLQSAVSSMEVEYSEVLYNSIEKIINDYEIIVIDCNLSKELIKKISILSKEKEKLMIAAATSEPKSLRLVGALGFLCLCMNRKEAEALKKEVNIERDEELLDYFDSLQLLITDGENGALFWSSKNQKAEKIPAPNLGKMYSPIGAGDATCAGYIDFVLKNSREVSVSSAINNCTKRVLESNEPNLLSSNLSPEALNKTWKRQYRKNKLVKTIAWSSSVGGFVIFVIELLKSCG